jgi:hypothetical protein
MKKRTIVFSFILLIVGGYLGTLIQKIPYITLNPMVDIIGLGNLIFVICLTILIPIFVTTRMDNDRSRKDMLIDELKIFCDFLESVSEALETSIGQTPNKDIYTKVLSSFKKARQTFSVISEQLDETPNKELLEQKVKLENYLELYWLFVTGDGGIKMSNYTLTSTFYWKQSSKFDDTTRSARQLKFLINNS